MVFQNIPKGQAFRVVLTSQVAFTTTTSYDIPPRNQSDIDAGSGLISKDGGAFQPLTNTGVFIAKGAFYVELTTNEMDADRIDIVYTGPTQKFTTMATILTSSGSQSGSGGLALTDTVTDILNAPDENPTVGDVLSFIYQYFRKRRKRKEWSLRRHLERG